MKVIVIGGKGVFGARLVTLLRRDGHDVFIAGRTVPPNDPTYVRVDRAGDLSPLWTSQPDVIIDAAGPFQSYGDEGAATP